MSRITGSEAKSLMEAYAAVYTSQEQEITEEQIWEEVENWVNSLLEEGYDLSEYTWEEMYEAYIEEDGVGIGQGLRQQFGRARRAVGDIAGATAQGLLGQTTTSKNPIARSNNFMSRVASTPTRFAVDVAKGFVTGGSKPSDGGSKPPEKPSLGNIPTSTKNSPYTAKNLGADQFKDYKAGGGDAAMAAGTGTAAQIIARGRAAVKNKNNSTSAGSGTGSGSGSGRGGNGLDKPKVMPSKPAAAQTGDKSKDMASWAKANPNLATAAAEKARIRGTAQTDNPMIDKGMRSRMQVTPTVQSPAVAKLGAGNQSLTQNKFAGQSPTPPVKAATPSQAIAAAPKPSAAASGSLAPATASIAAKPSSAMSQDAIRKQRLNMEMEYDAYDLVLEYLIDNGHAETVDEAHYIMLEMDAQMVGVIVEETLQEKLKPGTRGKISFATGKQNFDQKMTETNPRTGRQRATSPELKAMGAHGRAKSAQYDAENRGDTEAARKHKERRERIAHTVYRKTNRIIDRADND